MLQFDVITEEDGMVYVNGDKRGYGIGKGTVVVIFRLGICV